MSRRRAGPRPAVIGTCALAGRGIRDPQRRLDDGLQMVDEMARRAGQEGWDLDLVVLPESFAHVDGDDPTRAAQTLDGPIVAAVAQKARAYRTYATAPLWLRDGSIIFNSTVLLDRQGQPAGVYHKVYPVVMPDGSLESGITPGHEFPVFDLEFGRVGIQICFDACYDAGWEALGAQEAELVLLPSGGGSTVSAISAFAYRHGYYVVSSSYRAPAVVIDPLGHEIARAAQDRDVAVVRIDLDYRILPSRFLWTRGKEIKERYGEAVDFGWHDAEGHCLLTSRDPALPIGELVRREGLETLREFLARNEVAQNAARGRAGGRVAVPAG
jgi:predicted amidohydrolase